MDRGDIDKDLFIELFNKGYTKQELKKFFNCSIWTINNRLEKYKLERNFRQSSEIKLSKEQIDVIYGALLGDGYLMKSGNYKEATSCFAYSSSNKYHVEYIFSFLKEFATDSYKNGPKEYKIYDKRTNKTYTRYTFKTIHNISFEKIRQMWYKDEKIIPYNLELNKLILKIWYLGDGCLLRGHVSVAGDRKTIGLKLCTDGFNPIYVKNIIKKLRNFNAKIVYRNQEKTQSVIEIPRIKVKEFLSYIGDCPVKGYEHKWNYIASKYDKIEKYGLISLKDKQMEIVKDYLSGSKITELSKKYKCTHSLISYYLKKNNIELRGR